MKNTIVRWTTKKGNKLQNMKLNTRQDKKEHIISNMDKVQRKGLLNELLRLAIESGAYVVNKRSNLCGTHILQILLQQQLNGIMCLVNLKLFFAKFTALCFIYSIFYHFVYRIFWKPIAPLSRILYHFAMKSTVLRNDTFKSIRFMLLS